ncbi:knotted carbamoyltransferase YgeW [bacterium]|nr:knotted carbamoyltransferase YgeW [bacterium]
MDEQTLRDSIDGLLAAPNDLYDGDFLLSWNVADASIRNVAAGAAILADLHKAGLSSRVFDTGVAVSMFRDKSTRTRYSFRSACNLLGLLTEELDESTSQVAHGETVRETAAMVSFLTEVIGIRDDMFVDEGRAYMKEVAASVEDCRAESVIPHRPAVINLQCDLDHPTQSMADLCHLVKHFGGLEKLSGKKIAMSWAYSPSYGKPLSVPQGIISLLTRFGMDVTLAHPEGYELLDEPMQAAAKHAGESGGSFRTVHSMDEAFEGADIVYPKSWAPLAVMRERTAIRRSGETAKLAGLEKACLAQNAKHIDWECTEERMKSTANGKALYMHCLPADISGVSCERGEVAASVFERARLFTYREASWKPYVIAMMILAARFPRPSEMLAEILDRGMGRTA